MKQRVDYTSFQGLKDVEKWYVSIHMENKMK